MVFNAARAMNMLPDRLQEAWLYDICSAMAEKEYPTFLLAWAEMCGTFVGPAGSRFVWCLPDFDVTDGHGDTVAGSVSSFPNFHLLRRVISNQIRNRPWSDFRADGRNVDAANVADLDADDIMRMPGLTSPPSAMTPYAINRAQNLDVVAVDPQTLAVPATRDLRFLLQFKPDYEGYVDTIFQRMKDDGVPMGKYVLPTGVISGNEAGNYVARPSAQPLNPPGNNRPDYFYLTTAKQEPDIPTSYYARLFRPTVIKDATMVREPVEVINRWDAELIPDVSHTSNFSAGDIAQTYAAEVFAIFAPR